MPPTLIVVLLVIGVAVLTANLIATLRIIRNDFGSLAKKIAQIAFVWFIPVIGAAVAIFLTRSSLESGTGHSTKETEEPEDVAVAQLDYSSSD